jgi:hypothetical protein
VVKDVGKSSLEGRDLHDQLELSDIPKKKYRRHNYSTLAHKVQRQMIYL